MNDIDKAIKILERKTSIPDETCTWIDIEEAYALAIAMLRGSEWIPFEEKYDEDYEMEILQDPLPEDGEEILVCSKTDTWKDTFMQDGDECWLDSGESIADDVIAWMPLPKPWKAGDID